MYTLPDLNYSYEALEPIMSKTTLQFHHDKHFATYLANLNNTLSQWGINLPEDASDLLKDLDSIPAQFRTAIINNGGGFVNHKIFFEQFSANPQAPSAKLMQEIVDTFSSFEKFKEDLVQASLTQFGSGWAFLVRNKKGKLEILKTSNQDCPISQGCEILIAVDVWEHAYYLDYQNLRKDFVEKMISILDWTNANKKA